MLVQAQDPGTDAAMQAVQQSTQIATQAAQQATQQANQAAQQANQQASQDAQNAAASSGPFPQRVKPRTSRPSLSPSAGKYSAPTVVTIQIGTPNAQIFYTLDGSNPTLSSTPYTGPIQVSSTCRLKVIAFSKNNAPSKVLSAKYVIR